MVLKFLIILQTFLKLKSSFVAKWYHWPFLQCYMTKIANIEKQGYGKKRDSKWYLQNSYSFPMPKIYHKLLFQTSITSHAQILSSQARKRCFDLLTISYKQIQKTDAGCTITPLATETRRYICIRPTVTKVCDKLSRAVSVKYTS